MWCKGGVLFCREARQCACACGGGAEVEAVPGGCGIGGGAGGVFHVVG